MLVQEKGRPSGSLDETAAVEVEAEAEGPGVVEEAGGLEWGGLMVQVLVVLPLVWASRRPPEREADWRERSNGRPLPLQLELSAVPAREAGRRR